MAGEMTTWAILASGPSMSQEVADSVRGLPTIAVSNTYELAPWAEVLVSNDRRWWVNYPKSLEFAGEKVCGLCIEPPRGVTKFAGAMSGSNSGLLALMVAVKKGATRVLLLGFDMGGTHYFGDHRAPLMNPSPTRFRKFKEQFQGYKPKGVEIINCTPNSALRCYPFGDVKDYVTQPEPEPEPVIEKDLTGPEGPRGAEGPKGERGPRGPQGEQGPIGPMPDHQWAGTSLRFEEPDGTWGKYVDLRGPVGVQGYPGGGGGGGQGMTPEQALQLQTMLAIFGGWISTPPVPVIDEVSIDDLEVSVEGSATGFYPVYPFIIPPVRLDAAYEWDWGDGSPVSTTIDAAHTYAEAGTYTISFRAKNHIGWSSQVTEEVTVSSGGGAGTLSIDFTNSSSAYDIAALGYDGFAIWLSSVGAGTSIPAATKQGSGSRIGPATCSVSNLNGFSAANRAVTWSGAAPVASGTATDGIYNGLNGGGTSTSGADVQVQISDIGTTAEEFYVYLDAYNSVVTLTATLSDASADPAVNSELNATPVGGGIYKITAAAASAGQTLTIRAEATTANGAYSDVELQSIGILTP